MDISVIGASGACGREVVTRLVADGVLGRRELLQLVGGNPAAACRWKPSSARRAASRRTIARRR